MPINQGKQDNEDLSKKCIRYYFVINIESWFELKFDWNDDTLAFISWLK